MTVNADLARLFSEMATVLELTGANVFRVNAHTKVARILEGLPAEVTTLGKDAKSLMAALTAIDGVGEGSAKKIIEYIETGKVREHDELMAQIPPGLMQLTGIAGLGPKTIRLMWEQAGVVDLASLKQKLESGELLNLPRMGEKTLANIRASLEFMATASERKRLGEAMPVAEAIVAALRSVKGVKEVAFAGSLRRGKETIGDIDIVAAATDAAPVMQAFMQFNGAQKLVSGETKSSIRLNDMQVDLRVVDPSAFGAALLYFTGSKEHNVALRERAIKMGFRLNEYGLFPDIKDEAAEGPPQKRGVKPKASKTEADIYAALKLPYLPPEIREARGELELKETPRLIEVEDIKAELHAHTVASDGVLTIEQLANEAKRRGFHTIAVTDHSRSSFQANGLDIDRLLAHIEAVREAAEKVKGITILAGSEVDILIDGRLDYPDEVLEQLDIVVASPHASLKQAPEVATKRLLAAVRHPLVHILGHPTGRLINRRDGLSPDLHKIIEAAIEHDVALEINANHLRLDLRDTHVRAAVEAGAKIAINTDAHGIGDFDELRYGVLTGRRGWLTPALCVNTWTKPKLHAWLKKKRNARR